MSASETARHRDLKRLALAWAQIHGYRIAAAEVSSPTLGARFDVAAFRPAVTRKARRRGQPARHSPATTAIFECKQSRADFLKDSRCAEKITARLAQLHERRLRYEEGLRLHLPSLRNADTLFPEFDSYRFAAAGYAPYDKLTRELALLTARLHTQTKFADLFRWRAANLHYLIAEENVAQPHELPHGWGLLLRRDAALVVAVEPTWQDTTEDARQALLLRIAIAATKAVNQTHDVEFPAWENARNAPPLISPAPPAGSSTLP